MENKQTKHDYWARRYRTDLEFRQCRLQQKKDWQQSERGKKLHQEAARRYYHRTRELQLRRAAERRARNKELYGRTQKKSRAGQIPIREDELEKKMQEYFRQKGWD